MRIALVYLGRRGSGPAFSLQLAGALSQIAQVRAFISAYVDNDSAWQESGIEFVALPTFQSPLQALIFTAFSQRIQRIASEIATFAPDVLLFCMFHPWNGMLQRRLASVRSVVVVHDPQPHPGLLPRLHRLGEDYSLRVANIAMVLSQSLTTQLIHRGVPAARIRATRHGLLSAQQDNAIFVPPDGEQKKVLFFGRITQYKGLEILLQAWAKVQTAIPESQLTIAGSGSLRPYKRWLNDLPGVEVINHWVGNEEARLLFKRTNLVVVPYTSASQSGVVLLAAEAGRVVVATRVGGLPEQIRDGATGILVEPGDVDGLARAISGLLLDPQNAMQLGQQLQQDYRENFNWSQIAVDVLSACQAATSHLGEKK